MHVRKLPSGKHRWIAQFRGERRSGTEEARGDAFLAGSRAMLAMGAVRPANVTLTVGDLIDAWRGEKVADWSPTYAADMATVATRIPADFLHRNVDSVTPPVVATLHRQLIVDGWSKHRISRAHVAISQAFKLAVAYGWANEDPTRDLKAPAPGRPDVNPPEGKVVRALVAAAPERIALVIRLAAITGARLGELVALRWLDLDGDVLTIRRAAIYTPGSGLVVREATKTGRKGDRRLELDEHTVALLADHRLGQLRSVAGKRLPSPVYMFSHDGGVTPWRPGYVGLEYRRMRAKVPGAEGVRFHDLRHHVATEMLHNGEEPIRVAAQLGHSTPATTLRTYAHYLAGRGGESARRRAALLDD